MSLAVTLSASDMASVAGITARNLTDALRAPLPAAFASRVWLVECDACGEADYFKDDHPEYCTYCGSPVKET